LGNSGVVNVCLLFLMLRSSGFSPYFRIFRSSFFTIFEKYSFWLVFVLYCLQVWQELDFRPNSPPQDSSLRPQSNQRPPTVHPTTLHSPFPPRVPGLPIRDCARGCNNRGLSRPKLSAIDVTEKTVFERLYLVLGLRKFAP